MSKKFRNIPQSKSTANSIGIELQAALALHQRGQLAEAQLIYEKILRKQSNHFDALHLLGVIFWQTRQLERAVELIDKAIKISPNNAAFYSNRGNALKELEQFDAAIADYDKAIQLKPDLADAYSNRGLALQDLKKFDAAIASYDKAIQLKPDYVEVYWNNSLALLRLGDFSRGWELYEWRWRRDDSIFEGRGFTKPLWLGIESLQNKTILIHAEQGLGDTIQFCRYVKSVTSIAAKVVLEVQPSLVKLMEELDLSLDILARGTTLPNFDYHCPLLSLPLAFQNIGDTAIPTESYIKAGQARIEKWRSHFNNGGFNIGINWQGNANLKIDIGRSFPLALFEGVASFSKVKLFSLQKNEGTEQLNNLPKEMVIESFGEDVDSEGAFLDTAAIIKSLDLVITSDTAVAHLAGALGCRVWLVLKWVPDWRWMLDEDSSSWYPSMRLFRQNKADDWEGVFDKIESELNLLVQKNG